MNCLILPSKPLSLWTASSFVRFSRDCDMAHDLLQEGDKIVVPLIISKEFIDSFGKEFDFEKAVKALFFDLLSFDPSPRELDVFIYADVESKVVDFKSMVDFLSTSKPIMFSTGEDPESLITEEQRTAHVQFDKVLISIVDSAPLFDVENAGKKEFMKTTLSEVLFKNKNEDAFDIKNNMLYEDVGIISVRDSHFDFMIPANQFTAINDYIFDCDKHDTGEIHALHIVSGFSVVSRLLDLLRGDYLNNNKKIKIGFME